MHVGKYYPPYAGGMENFLRDLVHALARCGVPISVLVHNQRSDWVTVGNIDKDPWVLRVPSCGAVLYAPISPAFLSAFKKMIHRFRPDLLHLHVPNTSAFWALAVPEARKIPWVVHWHADVVPSAIDRRLTAAYRIYRPLETRLLRQARAVIATSPPYLETSEPLKPWRAKCRIVPLGIDPLRVPEPAVSARADAERMWAPDGLRVLSVGRLTYYKGHDVLIRAVARVPEARAVIVGTGPEGKKLRELSRRCGLQTRVFFAGWVPDERLHALAATCDVLCLPSKERTEAFGLVLLEAMRYEKPVVASDVPGSGMGWVVRHGETGVLVRPGDAEDLAGALRALARDPEAREAMGKQGGERFRAHFHIDSVARDVLGLYGKVAGGDGYGKGVGRHSSAQ